MKNQISTLIAALFLPFLAIGQQSFERFYGAPGGTVEEFLKVVALSDGGYLFAGTDEQDESNVTDVWLVRTDAASQVLWEKKIGGADFETVTSLAVTTGGEFFIVGQTFDAETLAQTDSWLLKTDASGNEIWTNSIPDFLVTDVAATADGFATVSIQEETTGVASVGKLNSSGAAFWISSIPNVVADSRAAIFSNSDGTTIYAGSHAGTGAAAVKIGDFGVQMWLKTFPDNLASPPALQETLLEVIETPIAGGYLFLGESLTAGKYLLTKTDAAGEIQWQAYTQYDIGWNGNSNVAMVERPDGVISVLHESGIQNFSATGNSLLVKQFSNFGRVNDLVRPVAGNLTSAGSGVNPDFGRDGVQLVLTDSLVVLNSLRFGDGLPVPDESPWNVRQTADGGYLVSGTKSFAGNSYDFYLLKTDPAGNVEWESNYGDATLEQGYTAEITPDGGFLFAGRRSQPAQLVWIKTNSTGGQVWKKELNYSSNSTLRNLVLPDGASMTFVRGGSPFRVRILKSDATGDTLWTRAYQQQGIRDARVTSDGNVITTGWANAALPDTYAWVHKLDLDGNTLFQKVFYAATPGITGISYGIEEVDAGDFVFTSFLDHPADPADSIVITRIDGNTGAIEWEQFFSDGQSFFVRAPIVKTIDNQLVIASGYDKNNGESGLKLLKINPNGDLIWEKDHLEGSLFPFMNESDATADGGFIGCGTVFRNGSNDIFLLKTLADGTIKTIDIKPLGELSISPNPSSGPVSLRFESTFSGPIQLELFDAEGRLVRLFSEEKTGPVFEKTMPIDGLSAGVFFVKLTADGRHISRSLVKN